MTEDDVIAASKEYFTLMTGRKPTTWPNMKASDVLPRHEFKLGPTVESSVFVNKGDPSNHKFLLQVDTVVAVGEGETNINAYVQLIIDHFSFGTKYGGFTVSKRPQKGTPDGSEDNEYRIPVTIELSAIIG